MKNILYALLLLGLIPNAICAQIIPDSSLGAENSRVESEGDRDIIEGGAIRGNNLFHSFEEFNIKAGREANFTPSDNIENIFSRVTGNKISHLNGILGVSGNANLYLMNPNGIIFGKNSQLNINGSFFATTADSILFKDNQKFHAVNPDTPPLLIVDIPIGLQFRDNPGNLNNFSQYRLRTNNKGEIDSVRGLKVKNSNNITFLGGNINLKTSGITAPGGNIELGSLSESGTVTIKPDGSLSFPEGLKKGDISLSDNSRVNVRNDGNGLIRVNANKLTLERGSRLAAGITKNLKITESVPQSINIDSHQIILNNGVISNQVQDEAEGNAGDINLITNSLDATDSSIFTEHQGTGEGDAGDITLKSLFSINLENSQISSVLDKEVTGKSGDITLESSTIALNDRSKADASTKGNGNAGKIEIIASKSLTLFNRSQFISQVTKTATGNAGKIDIKANSLIMTRTSSIESNNNQGIGDAGNIVINVADRVSLSQNSKILSNVLENGLGNGGSIAIYAKHLDLDDSKIIAAIDREFRTSFSVEQELSNIKLFIDKNLTFRNQSLVSVKANQNSNGGNIEIEAEFIIAYPSVMFGSDIRADADIGRGGNITLTTNRVFGLQPRVETEGKQDNLNDIDASSEFNISGQIAIEQPDVNFDSDLAESNLEIIDASKLITQNVCQQIANSKFVDIGKGGLPENPHETLTGITIDIGLVTPVTKSGEVALNNKKSLTTIPPSIDRETHKLPAQGWIQKENGIVELISYSPNYLRERHLPHNLGGCARSDFN